MVKMSLLEKRVVIHELPLGIHAVIAGEITGQIRGDYNHLLFFHKQNVIVSRNDTVIPNLFNLRTLLNL
jgi:hypothetical protein